MGVIDYLIFIVYVGMVIACGLLARRRERDAEDFYLAGRRVSAFAMGLSVMVTLFNAINFSAFPAEVIGHGLYVLISVPVFLIVAWPVARWIIPFFRKQSGISGYAWLEDRFNSEVRRTAAGLFLLWRMAWMATALYALGRIVGAITGLPPALIMFITVTVSVLYISWGGLLAVIWTDVLQFCVLLGAVVFALVFAVMQFEAGLSGLLEESLSKGLLQPWLPNDPAFWGWDPTMRISFWSGVIGTFVAFFARYGADQMILQRYLSAKSLKAAQQGIWINAWAAAFVLLLLALLGLFAGGLIDDGTGVPPAVLLGRFFSSMPPGFAGLVSAGMLAATMSSLDSGMHACSVTVASDFNRTGGGGGNAGRLQRPVGLIVLMGVLVYLLALPLGYLGGLFEIVNKVINGLGSPLLAMVLVAMWRRGITARGLVAGGICGFLAGALLVVFVTNLALHYYAVVNLLLTIALCLVFSGFDRLRQCYARISSATAISGQVNGES